MVALTINSIIGSGVFGLPSVVAELLGRWSPVAVLLAGAAMGVFMACFAEVASQFSGAGGPYLYVRTAFGPLAGIEVGWIFYLAQSAASAANANLFVIYLGEFWPHAKDPWPRFLVISLLIGILTLLNIRGVKAGARVSDIFTVAKLVPLLLVAGVGVVALHGHAAAGTPWLATTPHSWLSAMLLLVFAYGGFESALALTAEAKDPQRDVVFSLFTALVVCGAIYAAVQWAVVGLLPNAAHTDRPLAEVARLTMGGAGAAFVAVGALLSMYGYLSAKILSMPRVTYALGQSGDLPQQFAAIHPRFLTPHVSIAVFSMLVWLLALAGSFGWNVTLSAVARLLYYGLVCAALPVLRRMQPTAARFRLPGGVGFAGLGVVLCLVLATQLDLSKSLILSGVMAVALVNWLWVRKRAAA